MGLRISRDAKKMYRTILSILIFLILSQPLCAESFQTRYPFNGVTWYHKKVSVPRPLNIHILVIDPTAPGIKFRVSASSGTPETSLKTVRNQLTTQHNADPNARIAINGSFFFYGGSIVYNRGLVASDGTKYSPWDSPDANDVTTARPWPVLNISQSNVMSFLDRPSGTTSGYNVIPSTTVLYNAISGNEKIVINGTNHAGNVSYGNPRTLNPRTVMGVTYGNKIVIMTIDGRQSGVSEGVFTSEAADMLIELDVKHAVNYDGGGSTTLCFADPTPRVINVPVDVSDVPGSARSVGACWFVFANDNTQANTSPNIKSSFVIADFENADEFPFTNEPGYSGSTYGINESASTAQTDNTSSYEGNYNQKISIVDDTNVMGGWFVRHLCGSASRSGNMPQTAHGFIGLWAKTLSNGVSVSIAIDNTNNVTADRGMPIQLIGDNQWHLYEWNLDDDIQWDGWVNGDGIIDSEDFTVDSIQFFSDSEINADIYVDNIIHNSTGTLGLPGDLNYDNIVNFLDYEVFATSWFVDELNEFWNPNCNLKFPRDNYINSEDFSVLIENWLD